MTTFLLLISLFLNILALFLIIILYLRQNRFLQVEKKQEKMMQEMEEVISAYLVQMKEENEEFIKRMSKVENTITASITKERKSDLNEELKDSEMTIPVQGIAGKANIYSAAKAYKQFTKMTNINPSASNMTESIDLPPLDQDHSKIEAIEKENSNLEENSLLEEILQLKEQGFNETEIAQKLNKGKTEVALLLKFNQK